MARAEALRRMMRGLGPRTRALYEDLAGGALEEGNTRLRGQTGGYFDTTRAMENPSIRVDTDLTRYDPFAPGRRGAPPSLDRVSGARSKRLLNTTLQGIRQGAHGWYNTAPLKAEFIDELGPVAGDYNFNRFMDFVAATSPREKVKQNIRRASEVYRRDRSGEPIMGLLQPEGDGPAELRMPPGYGTLAHNLHTANIEDIAMMGGLDPIGKPKVSSFAENLKGNYAPMTMDTHNRAMVFPEDVQTVYNKSKGQYEKKMKSPAQTEYGLLEEYQGELGRMLGLDPAQWQSSLWTGGATETGVADPRNFMEMFNDAIKRTSEKHGITERDAARSFIRGEIPLASVMGAGLLFDPEEEGMMYG